jgi:hypothetical protein
MSFKQRRFESLAVASRPLQPNRLCFSCGGWKTAAPWFGLRSSILFGSEARTEEGNEQYLEN